MDHLLSKGEDFTLCPPKSREQSKDEGGPKLFGAPILSERQKSTTEWYSLKTMFAQKVIGQAPSYHVRNIKLDKILEIGDKEPANKAGFLVEKKEAAS